MLFLIGAIILSVFALYPDLRLPEFAPSGKHTDFVYHAMGFLALTVFGLIAVDRSAKMVAVLAALAIILESLQYFVPGRRVFAIDLAASLLGVTLGVVVMISRAQLRRWWSEFAWLR